MNKVDYYKLYLAYYKKNNSAENITVRPDLPRG